MNIVTLISLAASFGVFIVSVFIAFENPAGLIDAPSILIVVGGTLTTTMVCFSPQLLLNLIKVFLKRVLGKTQVNYHVIIQDISELAKASRKGRSAFDAAVKSARHPFLKEGAELLYWSESDISEEELRDLLETRTQSIFETYMADAQIFKTISKLPPAFGMMGTTIGMIALLQGLGGNNDSLGKAMAIALITTLYGLIGSNLLITPISENLAKQAKEDKLARVMIVEGLMLIHAHKPAQYIEEKVKSFLLPSKRPARTDSSNGQKAA